MSASESGLRQRKPVDELVDEPADNNVDSDEAPKPKPKSKSTPKLRKPRRSRAAEEDDYSPYLDILRVLTFLFVASCGLSYLISNGESWFWGIKDPPDYLTKEYWWQKYTPPRYMTLEELAAFDGSDPDSPLYLSINGSIYDVSAGRHMYGPGGSYHWFAGVDASRGFVTGCFSADRTGDMRGVEEMFLPRDNPEVDNKYWTPEQLAQKKKEELAAAHQHVHDALGHWCRFFAKNKKYPFVAYLQREPGWEGERKPLCKPARDGRQYRKAPDEEDD